MEFIEIDDKAREIIAERAKREAPERSGGGKDGKKIPSVFLTIDPDTTHVVRVLPPWTREGEYAYSPYVRTNQHWGVGPYSKIVICPKHTPHSEDKRCFVCEQVDALFQTGDKNDEARAKKLYAKKNYIYQVIDRNDPVWEADDEKISEHPELAGQPKIKFMRLPFSGSKQIEGIISDPEWGDITNPKHGNDLTVTRRGSGLNTEYGCMPKRNASPIFDDPEMINLTAQLMSKLDEHPFFRPVSYDETKAIYMGMEVEKASELSAPAARDALPATTASAFSGGSSEDPYSKWVHTVRDGEPMDRHTLAARNKWNEAQIPPCYSNSPNHRDNDCWDCPVKSNCATQYSLSNGGRYSESAPVSDDAAAPASPAFGKKAADVHDDVPF